MRADGLVALLIGMAVPASETAIVHITSRPLRVEVRDERDRPVAGVAVAAASAPAGGAALTGADGRFTVADLVPGPQRFTAHKAGLPEADSDALEVAAGGTVAVTLTLARGASLALTVQDPDGRAVVGATAKAWMVPASRADAPRSATSMREHGGEPASTGTAAADGSVRFSPLAPGALALELTAPEPTGGGAVRGHTLLPGGEAA